MTVIKRDGRWTVDFWYEGKRYRKKSPIDTQRGAKEYERLLLQRLMQGEPLTPQTAKSEESATAPTCRSFLREWLETYAKTNNKPSEIKSKELIIRCHLSPFFGKRRVSEIGVRELERFKSAQLSKGLSPKTINNQLSVLRRALRSAQEWGVIEVVPTIKWMKAPRADFDFLDFEEAERLFDATVPEYRPMVATALKAGLRLGELLALRQTDVDLVHGQIFVKRSVWKRTFGTPKNGLSRRVPIPPSLVRILRDHRHLRGELVFCQEDGSLLDRRHDQTGAASRLPKGGPRPHHPVARASTHLRESSRDARRAAQGGSGALGPRQHRGDDDLRPFERVTTQRRRRQTRRTGAEPTRRRSLFGHSRSAKSLTASNHLS